MSLTATDLREAIHEAFDSAALPEHVDDLLLEPYRSSIDATEMAADFAGRSWAAIPIQELFSHRQMLSTMSAVAYRAYIAAYLLACVNEDPSASRTWATSGNTRCSASRRGVARNRRVLRWSRNGYRC